MSLVRFVVNVSPVLLKKVPSVKVSILGEYSNSSDAFLKIMTEREGRGYDLSLIHI